MKKIAIVTRKMIAGGIEKALISMLEVLPKDEFEITLFVMASGGEFERYIPEHVRVKCLYGEENSAKDKILNSLKRGKLIGAIKILFNMFMSMKVKEVYKKEWYLSRILPKQEEEFDLAIAYHTPASFPVIYVSEHIRAKSKIAWIHSDVEVYKKELERYIEYYSNFEKIYCVSKDGKVKFDTQYPELKNKTDVFYNIINENQIKSLASCGEAFNDNFDGIRILTVGRLTKEKGCDILPEIIDNIIKSGFDVKWYLIGDGEERKYLNEKIEEMQLYDRLILLGTKTNPYPYFKNCDIYVQPSRHEGYCITLAEAKRFNKPIITTNFIGALEQIINNETGLIVNFDSREIEDSIIKIINNESIRSKLIYNLKKLDYTRDYDIKKIYNLMK